MPVEDLFFQTLTVITKEMSDVKDDMGNYIVETTGTTNYAGKIQPRLDRSTFEHLLGRDTVVANWKAFLPANAAVTYLDQIVADGVTYEVVGPPYLARGPLGVNHIEIALREYEG